MPSMIFIDIEAGDALFTTAIKPKRLRRSASVEHRYAL
jgi:hypothetical protein